MRVDPAGFEGLDPATAARVGARTLELMLSATSDLIGVRPALEEIAVAVRAWAADPTDATKLNVEQAWLRVMVRYDQSDDTDPEAQFCVNAGVDVGLLDPVPYARACTLAVTRHGADRWAAEIGDELGSGARVDARAVIELCAAVTVECHEWPRRGRSKGDTMSRATPAGMLSLLDEYRQRKLAEKTFIRRFAAVGIAGVAAWVAMTVIGARQVDWPYFAAAALTGGLVIGYPTILWLGLHSPAERRREAAERALRDAVYAWKIEDGEFPLDDGDTYDAAEALWVCQIEAAAIRGNNEADPTERQWASSVTSKVAEATSMHAGVRDAAAFVALCASRHPGLDRTAFEHLFAQCRRLTGAWEAIAPLRAHWRTDMSSYGTRQYAGVSDAHIWNTLEALTAAGPDAVRVAGALAEPTWTLTQLLGAATDVAELAA